MKLRLVTVALNPETGMFPTEPLAEVEGEILSVVEHFFHFAGGASRVVAGLFPGSDDGLDS